jgi:hypothetical protein
MSPHQSSFEDESKKARRSLLREIWDWMGENRKWWLSPIILALIILGTLVLISGTPLGQWIYSVF